MRYLYFLFSSIFRKDNDDDDDDDIGIDFQNECCVPVCGIEHGNFDEKEMEDAVAENAEEEQEEEDDNMIFELQISYLEEILKNEDQPIKFKVSKCCKKWKLDHSYAHRVIEDCEQNVLRLSGNYFKVTLLYHKKESDPIVVATGDLDVSEMVSERPVELDDVLLLKMVNPLEEDTESGIKSFYIKYKVWSSGPLAPMAFLFHSNRMLVKLQTLYVDFANLRFPPDYQPAYKMDFMFPMKAHLYEPVSFNGDTSVDMLIEDLEYLNSENIFFDDVDRAEYLKFIRMQYEEDLQIYKKVEFEEMYRNILTRQTMAFVKQHFVEEKNKFEFTLNMSSDITLQGSLDMMPFQWAGVNRGLFLVGFGRKETVQKQSMTSLVSSAPTSATSRTKRPKSPARSPKKWLVSTEVERKVRAFALIEIEFKDPFKEEDSIGSLVQTLNCPLPVNPLQNFDLPDEDKDFKDLLQHLHESIKDAHLHSIQKRNFTMYVEHTNMRTDLIRILRKRIGTHFNVIQRTRTNHEFKILICDVYDYYSSKAHEIFEELQNVKRQTFDARTHEQRIFLAKLAVNLGDYTSAEDIHKSNIHEFDKTEEVFVDYFLHLESIRDSKRAQCILNKLLQLNPKSLHGLIIYSYHLYLKNEIADAITIMRILTIIEPTCLEVWLMLYVLLKKMSETPDFEEEIYIFSKILKLRETSFKNHLHDRQEVFFREFRSTDKEKHANILKAMYLFMKMGCHEFVELIIQKFQKFFNTFDIDLQEIYYLRMINMMYLRNFDEVLMQLKEIDLGLKQEGNNAMRRIICCLKGHCFFEKKEFENAIREYEISYHILSGPVESECYLAVLRCGIHFMQNKEYDESKDYLVSCCQDLPTYYSWKLLGINYFERRLYDKSQKCFDQLKQYSNLLKCTDVEEYLTYLKNRNSNREILYSRETSIHKQLNIYFNCGDGNPNTQFVTSSAQLLRSSYYMPVQVFETDPVPDPLPK